MQSPWQVGLLAIAITGVSTYDFIFMKNRTAPKRPVTEIHVSQPVSGSVEPLLAPLPAPAAPEEAMDAVGEDLRPAISLDELHTLSRQALVIKEDSESGNAASWTWRAPITKQLIARKSVRSIPSISEVNEPPVQNPLPAPQCIFSGTLIEGHKKLALVNGVPLMVGDRLGDWQLARIESDYIVLESGEKTHRIELIREELQSVRRKDPS
jgi:hypothetical protein